jgi:spermidine/putrescine transport system ATP-binding protein
MQASLMQPVSGSRCKLYIRPESVMLEPDTGLEGINRFTLEIRSLLFDGSNTKVLAAIEGSGPELIVALPQTGQFIHVRVGDKIAAGVHPTACGCYPE